jgi:hypothetical protein
MSMQYRSVVRCNLDEIHSEPRHHAVSAVFSETTEEIKVWYHAMGSGTYGSGAGRHRRVAAHMPTCTRDRRAINSSLVWVAVRPMWVQSNVHRGEASLCV